MPNQYVLVDKLTPIFDGYHRGDIVVFNPPASWAHDPTGAPYIKRIIGVGGDTVDIHDGRVFVNGAAARRALRVRGPADASRRSGAAHLDPRRRTSYSSWATISARLAGLAGLRTDRQVGRDRPRLATLLAGGRVRPPADAAVRGSTERHAGARPLAKLDAMIDRPRVLRRQTDPAPRDRTRRPRSIRRRGRRPSRRPPPATDGSWSWV